MTQPIQALNILGASAASAHRPSRRSSASRMKAVVVFPFVPVTWIVR